MQIAKFAAGAIFRWALLAAVTALLLALTLQVHKRRGSLDPEELRSMRE